MEIVWGCWEPHAGHHTWEAACKVIPAASSVLTRLRASFHLCAGERGLWFKCCLPPSSKYTYSLWPWLASLGSRLDPQSSVLLRIGAPCNQRRGRAFILPDFYDSSEVCAMWESLSQQSSLLGY